MPGNVERWQALEAAKRRLVYALIRLGLPLESRQEDEARGLAFDFLADAEPDQPVMTGHDDGLITINIAEADSAERERRRLELGEPYRTLLGHLRHEVGHYYWDVLVRDGGRIEAARAVFGDESADYQAALAAPLPERRAGRAGRRPSSAPTRPCTPGRTSPRPGPTTCTWSTRSTPPRASASRSIPAISDDPTLEAEIAFDPYRARNFDRLVQAWLPLTVAVNSLNRSMGQPDLYPFALSPRRSRSCASSTSWCTPLTGCLSGGAGRMPRRGIDGMPRSPSPPISAATARRPWPRPRARPCARCSTACSPRTRCSAATSSTSRGGCGATSTSSSAGG